MKKHPAIYCNRPTRLYIFFEIVINGSIYMVDPTFRYVIAVLDLITCCVTYYYDIRNVWWCAFNSKLDFKYSVLYSKSDTNFCDLSSKKYVLFKNVFENFILFHAEETYISKINFA